MASAVFFLDLKGKVASPYFQLSEIYY